MVEGVEILVQWIPAFARMTKEVAEMSRITIAKRIYASRAHRVSADSISKAGSGRLLHLFRFVIFSGAVRGQDDLERPQAIEPARARRLTRGHTAQEIRQHQRVHVLTHV